MLFIAVAHVSSGLFPGQLMVPGHPHKRTWSKCERHLVHFPKDHVCFGFFLGQLMVPGEGHGQNVKGAWSISQKTMSVLVSSLVS